MPWSTDFVSPRKTRHPTRRIVRPRAGRPCHKGFTVIELLTTVAILIIVLGLMVSLARYVRNALAVEVTKKVLHELDTLMQQYSSRHNGLVPAVAPLAPAEGDLPDELTLQRNALANNRDFLRALRADAPLPEESFGGLPQSIYNDATLRDAWGSPIVFMPSMREGIGMAPQDKPFFFSAGPDMQYRTQENNLYSYEK